MKKFNKYLGSVFAIVMSVSVPMMVQAEGLSNPETIYITDSMYSEQE